MIGISAGKNLVGIWTLSAVCALQLCQHHVRRRASATFPIRTYHYNLRNSSLSAGILLYFQATRLKKMKRSRQVRVQATE